MRIAMMRKKVAIRFVVENTTFEKQRKAQNYQRGSALIRDIAIFVIYIRGNPQHRFLITATLQS